MIARILQIGVSGPAKDKMVANYVPTFLVNSNHGILTIMSMIIALTDMIDILNVSNLILDCDHYRCNYTAQLSNVTADSTQGRFLYVENSSNLDNLCIEILINCRR